MKKIGQQIIKAVSLAINDIDNDKIEIIPKDTSQIRKPHLSLQMNCRMLV